MSVLVVGLSHKSAPVPTLERAVVTGDTLAKLLRDVFHADGVAGSLVVSTCNRVEVYAEVEKFHGGVSAICELLARHAGVPLAELTPHLYVHYEDRAVQHLFTVACGLDSMVIGEGQILGQVRQALRAAGEQGTLGRALSDLGSLALRAGKRAHAETGIDRAGASLVSVGLEDAARRLRGAQPAGAPAPAASRRAPRRGSGPGRLVGAGGRRGLDELAGGRDRGPDGSDPPRGGQPVRQPRAAAGGLRAGLGVDHGGRAFPAARRDRRRRPGRLLHGSARPRDLRGHRGGRAGVAGAGGRWPGGRWSCWTSRCRGTSIPPRRRCPA